MALSIIWSGRLASRNLFLLGNFFSFTFHYLFSVHVPVEVRGHLVGVGSCLLLWDSCRVFRSSGSAVSAIMLSLFLGLLKII